jgi:hypothetical protein
MTNDLQRVIIFADDLIARRLYDYEHTVKVFFI